MWTKRAAYRVGWRAWKRVGVPFKVAMYIAFACRKERLAYAVGYAVCEQESGYRHIFGHDAGGMFPGLPVTEPRYNELRERLRRTKGPGANGVGLFQITYYTYILDNPGLWKKRANAYKGTEIVAGNVRAHGVRKGLAVYNGGEGNPQYDYATQVEARIDRIRPQLEKEDK